MGDIFLGLFSEARALIEVSFERPMLDRCLKRGLLFSSAISKTKFENIGVELSWSNIILDKQLRECDFLALQIKEGKIRVEVRIG